LRDIACKIVVAKVGKTKLFSLLEKSKMSEKDDSNKNASRKGN